MRKSRRVTLAALVLSVWSGLATAPYLVSAQTPHVQPTPSPLNADSARTTGIPAHGTGDHAMSDHAMSDHAMSDHAMSDHAIGSSMDENMSKHMLLTPPRQATHDDSVRAWKVVNDLKRAITKYQDTAAAVADGYKMFLPNVKTQHVFHFTNSARAIKEAFRFDATQPTSILYERQDDGKLHLIGAMYTMPKRASLDRLNDRVPLSIAHWHQHVNWCLPKRGDQARWLEMKDAKPLFGPESPIATKADCDAVGGDFHPTLLGWMLHANVYPGSDLGAIFADEHGNHEMMNHAHP